MASPASSPAEQGRTQEQAADVYLLGSGVFSFLDITLYTQRVLKRCKTLFYLHDLPSLERYLKEITPNPVNLMPIYYIDGRVRMDIYTDITNHVIESAMGERPVGLLMHGHPLIYSTISQLIIEECAQRDLRVEAVAGVSSLDQMFVDLNLDIAQDGVQIFESTRAIRSNIQLDPAVGCILLQVGGVLENTASRNQTTVPDEIAPFKAYLSQFYGPDHPLKIVECAVEFGFTSQITEVKLGEMESAAKSLNYNATMYIAPALESGSGSSDTE